MKITYQTGEEDFLNSYLYTANHTPQVIKQRRNIILILASLGAIATLVFYYLGDNNAASYFLIFTLVIGLVYPFYQRYFYKKHYLKHIRANSAKLFGYATVLNFTDTHVIGESRLGDSKIPYASIKEIVEIKDQFLLRLINNSSVVIAKKELHNTSEIRQFLQDLAQDKGLMFVDALGWRWK